MYMYTNYNLLWFLLLYCVKVTYELASQVVNIICD